MGRPKESLLFGGETLIRRIANVLIGCAAPVVVVRRDEQQDLPELPDGVVVINDEPPPRGPLAAIATGLRHARDALGFGDADAMFVTGCDSPFLSAPDVAWLAGLLGDADLVVPERAGVLQPLCAIYRVGLSQTSTALLARGIASPHSLASVARARVLDDSELAAHDPELRFLVNVNDPAEYERARRIIEENP